MENKKSLKRLSIFNIERRMDFISSYERFINDLKNTVVDPHRQSNMAMMRYLEHCLKYWPYRQSASSIKEYLSQIDVDMDNPKSELEYLLIMELFINLLHYVHVVEKMAYGSLSFVMEPPRIDQEADRLIQNAEYFLEQCCNMRVRVECKEGIETPQYYISKRNERVDATVSLVPELADVMLGYLDVRNEDDRAYKKQALLEIYDYMEPKRDDYKGGIASSISEEFFASMNRLEIRHNRDSQIKIHYSKKNAVYDKLFFMSIYVLQSGEVSKMKDELKSLRDDKRKVVKKG